MSLFNKILAPEGFFDQRETAVDYDRSEITYPGANLSYCTVSWK